MGRERIRDKSRLVGYTVTQADVERFMSKVEKTDSCPVPGLPGGGCWLWRGGRRNKQGHGGFSLNGVTVSVHRFSFEQFRGPIPDDLVPDHLCMNPPCVNPLHLEPVTQQVNTLRCPIGPSSINARVTHCPKGHEYTSENTILTGGRRVCRNCHTDKLRRFREQNPEKIREYKQRYRERHPGKH